MSGISGTFEKLRRKGLKGFIPFVTAGDPDLETTVRLVPELERSGANVVELGIPFSDPVADGPTIQRSSDRALKHGYRMPDYLEAVRRIRLESRVPIVLFSYYNPVLQYGLERAARDAAAAGADGFLVTDITPEEAGPYRDAMQRNGLDSIFLVAPTSGPERVAKICACSTGFVYLVSRTGVTGAQASLSDSVAPMLDRVRRHTQAPVAVGFGISTPEHVRKIWELADAAVVGSSIVARMEEEGPSPELVRAIGDYCRWLTGSAG